MLDQKKGERKSVDSSWDAVAGKVVSFEVCSVVRAEFFWFHVLEKAERRYHRVCTGVEGGVAFKLWLTLAYEPLC